MAAKIEGQDRLERALRAMPIEAKVAARAALEKGADEMVRAAKSFAPKGEGAHELTNSIRKESGAHQLQVLVRAGGELTTRPVREGVDASYDYALAQEYGTAKMQANPFFWPAYRLKKRAIRARVNSAWRKVMRTVWGR